MRLIFLMINQTNSVMLLLDKMQSKGHNPIQFEQKKKVIRSEKHRIPQTLQFHAFKEF